MRAQRLALGLGDVHRLDRGQQQVVDLVHGVGDGRVGADEGALHAAGAHVVVELRHGEPEEALVLGGRGAGGHEQAGARQHRRLADRALAEGPGHQVLVVRGVEERARAGRARGRAHRRGEGDAAQRVRRRGVLVDRDELGRVVVDDRRRLHALPDDRHVALDHGVALAAELLGDLGADLVVDGLDGGPLRHPVDVPHHRADERDAHHPQLEVRRRGVPLGHAEGVDDQEVDPLLADRPPRVARQLPPDLLRGEVGLQDERAALDQSLERVGVDERLVVRRDDDLDVLELGVGEEHRLGAEGDVVVGRRAALLRAVLRRGLRVHPEDAGQDVVEQLARRDRAVAAHRVEADAHRRGRQQNRVGLGLQGHQLGLGVRLAQPGLDLGHVRGRILGEELGPQVDERRARPVDHVLVRGDDVARLHVVAAEAEDRRGQRAGRSPAPGCARTAGSRRSRRP